MVIESESKNSVRRVRVRLGGGSGYEIEIGRGALDALGESTRRALSPHARRVALISNRRVFRLYGERAVESLREAGLGVSHWLMGEGERHKSFRTAERALGFLAAMKLERGDAVVALGGGVVGDLAGFAAATYMRGVAYVQAPTTLLAQIDSSVGGKTAVNLRAGKNVVGAFHQPRLVIIDTRTLQTLPARELTAGWCEAIKQGAVGDRKLFEQVRRFLEGGAGVRETERASGRGRKEDDDERGRGDGDEVVDERAGRAEQLARLIASQCAFKARIVAGDEREEIGRRDARSRRILNFGHTVAHALETVTDYRRFRHGEAVGYGMVAASEISKRLGLLDISELELLRETVRMAGRLPHAADLDEETILDALRTDKKALGGHIQWVLLERLGAARIVSGEEIPARLVRDSLRAALKG